MTAILLPPKPARVYPDSDGKPMADNTLQGEWIAMLHGNLAALYRDEPLVAPVMNNLWYPLEENEKLCQAPDVYVVFGRPKGYRGSYQQWEEDDVPIQVVFEILSPSNTAQEMLAKEVFYEEYGVEEYYIYDPEKNVFRVHLRQADMLMRHRFQGTFVSPRMGVRFQPGEPELQLFYPDGRPFLRFAEVKAALEVAEQRASSAEQRATHAERVLARVKELNRKVLSQQATPDERAELERLLTNGESTP